jgi:acyl-coenzyme A thioesterase PaaI-like protein
MDMAAGVATKSQLDDPTRAVATVSLTVNYQRPGELGRTLIAEAVVKSGRRIVSCEVAVRDDRGEPIALGLATLHVR